jgi:hypothetical protein
MGIAGSETSVDAKVAPSQAQSDALDGGTTASFALWPFAELARRNQLSIEDFCALAGVEPSSLRDPDMRFSRSVANRVAELAFTRFGQGAAMAAALTVEAGHFNLVEVIARSAPTVADGLEQGCRFFPLVHDGGRMTYEIAGSGTHALRWWPPADCEIHRGYVELAFAVALRGIRRETGQDSLAASAVWFAHPPPASCDLHVQVLGKSVQFAMPYDQLVLSNEVSALPLTRRNQEVHATAADIATDLLDA